MTNSTDVLTTSPAIITNFGLAVGTSCALDAQAEARKMSIRLNVVVFIFCVVCSGLTKKAEPPPTRDVNRDSGTDSANGGWLRRLVRPLAHFVKAGVSALCSGIFAIGDTEIDFNASANATCLISPCLNSDSLFGFRRTEA